MEGWGAQELTETDELVTRTATSNQGAFADRDQWWSPDTPDTHPVLRVRRPSGIHCMRGIQCMAWHQCMAWQAWHHPCFDQSESPEA